MKAKKKLRTKAIRDELKYHDEWLLSKGIDPVKTSRRLKLKGIKPEVKYVPRSDFCPSTSDNIPGSGSSSISKYDETYVAAVKKLSTRVGVGYNKGGLEVITSLETLRDNGKGKNITW